MAPVLHIVGFCGSESDCPGSTAPSGAPDASSSASALRELSGTHAYIIYKYYTYTTTLLHYNTTLLQYTTTLHYTTLYYTTTLLHYTTTLQHYTTTLQHYITATLHYTTILLDPTHSFTYSHLWLIYLSLFIYTHTHKPGLRVEPGTFYTK